MPVTVTEILHFVPEKKVILMTLNPKLSTMKKAVNTLEGEYRLAICAEIVNTKELELIANHALYHDFRMLAITKLVLRSLKSVNWVRTKAGKISKINPKTLGISEPIFNTWVSEVLVKVLNSEQLQYLSHSKSILSEPAKYELKTRSIYE